MLRHANDRLANIRRGKNTLALRNDPQQLKTQELLDILQAQTLLLLRTIRVITRHQQRLSHGLLPQLGALGLAGDEADHLVAITVCMCACVCVFVWVLEGVRWRRKKEKEILSAVIIFFASLSLPLTLTQLTGKSSIPGS